jgi:hypothetical protein
MKPSLCTINLCAVAASMVGSGLIAGCSSSSIQAGQNNDPSGKGGGAGSVAGSGGQAGSVVGSGGAAGSVTDAAAENVATFDAGGADASSGVSCAVSGRLDWRARANLPRARFEVGAAVVKGKIYAIGGSDGATTSELDEYDPGTNAWTQKRAMSTARQNAVIGVVGDKIYVTAGYAYTNANDLTRPNTTEVYDPATDAWVTKAPIPAPNPPNSIVVNQYLGGGSVGDKIYVVVGEYTQTGDTLVYDTVNDGWSSTAPITLMATKPGGATTGDVLYVVPLQIPGAGYEPRIATFDRAAPHWQLHAGSATRREAPAVAAWAGALFVAGGWTWTFGTSNPSVAMGVVEAFEPSSGSWRATGDLPTPRALAAAAVAGGSLYVIGGAVGGPGAPIPSAVVEEATCVQVDLIVEHQ